MDDCIFCKIVKGEVPSYKVWENDRYFAFLDIHPVKSGHVLLIPKYHVDYFFNMEDKDLAEISVLAKPISKALLDLFKPQTGKVAMLFVGVGVAHIHVHLFPMDNESDINPANAYSATEEELKENQSKIKSALQKN